MSDRCSAVLADVRSTILRLLRDVAAEERRALSLLDLGCWDGEATEAYREVLRGSAHGVEVFPAPAAIARGRGIDVAERDLETERLPWPDAAMDVVVVNQVFEHLKNVWLPLAEIARVLRPRGRLVFSVPNLASLHNRAFLAFGRQPSSIRTFGPHVRGFTYRQAGELITFGGFLAIERAVGVGFYPRWAAPVGRLWVSGSHTPVILARREAGAGRVPPWLTFAGDQQPSGLQTYYPASRRSVA